MTKQELFESAARKLGPVRSRNALTAFVTGTPDDWNRCVLARAYGADGELGDAVRLERVPHGQRTARVAAILGLTVEEAAAIVMAFDFPFEDERASLIAALEAEASRLTPTSEPCHALSGFRTVRNPMAEKLTQFDYLLNAMEHAGHAKNPSKAGYGAKRNALMRHVRRLEESTVLGTKDAARLDWLTANARHELKIEREHTSRFSVVRWYRRYVSFHTWGGANLREAIDEAMASTAFGERVANDSKENG